MELRVLSRADLDDATALLARSCVWDEAARVADEKLFGAAPAATTITWGAFVGGRLVGVAAASARWIRLLAVDPDHRRRGIGGALLARCEEQIRADGHPAARALDQPGNYLAPGIDSRNEESIAWMSRRGWTRRTTHTSLLVDIATNPAVSADRARELSARAAERGYTIRRAEPREIDPLARAVEVAFSASGAFEVRRAGEARVPTIRVAVDADQQLAAYAAHDGNNRGLGWFGPTATFSDHRERGLGKALLVTCLVDLAATGREMCTVAWIGPRDFYTRAVGIAGELTYVAMIKDLQAKESPR